MAHRARSIVTEGLIAGLLGATTVALWFLIVDFVRGRPFLVPAALGHALVHAIGAARNEGAVAHILVYTVFHYIAFAVVGVLAAAILRRAETHVSVLAGAFLLFVIFEIGFYLLSAVIAESPSLGAAGWYFVALGNLIAAVVMGTYLWRAHPGLGARLDDALSGRELPSDNSAGDGTHRH